MIINKLLECVLILSAVLQLPVHAFWWAPTPSTTTTESPLAHKQIPLTYFRTYTYQPLPGTPFAAFPFYHHPASVLQSPLLAGATRYEHTAFMPGGGYPVGMALQQQQLQQQHLSTGVALPQLYQPLHQPLLEAKPLPSPTTTTSTTTARPTTTSTTTTTTTTTTTPPSTTASSTTSTKTSAPASSAISEVHSLAAYSSSAAYPYPTYNRRAYLGYNTPYYRAAYPYPDYTVYKTAPISRFGSHSGQVQFVPCMCPVSAGAAGAEGNAALSMQWRTADGEEGVINVPGEQKVASEKSERGVGDAAEITGVVEDASVSEKIRTDSEFTQNLAQKATGAVDEQLSTNKIEEDTIRAARETESRESDRRRISS